MLMSCSGGAYFEGSPLPAFIPRKEMPLNTKPHSVASLLALMQIKGIFLPESYNNFMQNINRPSDWEEVIRNEYKN
jgi:hypothetical protein